jgi:DNA/RNA-binding domain of Phe-tRNA-synthetase-like protein
MLTVRLSGELIASVPDLRIVLVRATDIVPGTASVEIASGWEETWEACSRWDGQNAQSHPRIAPWRALFTTLGISGKKYPVSVEAILRRALRGGPPFQVNPLVDFYNTVSLRHLVPVGAFDLRGLADLLEVRFARNGDHFQPLDGAEPEDVHPGHLVYALGTDVITLNFWRQSSLGLVDGASSDVLLASELIGSDSDVVAREVAEDLADGAARYFGACVSAAILGPGNEERVFQAHV